MIGAAFKAIGDVLSPEFRAILFKALGLTLALFLAVLALTVVLVTSLTVLPWPWAETLLAIGTGLVMLVAFIFLMAPVTALFAGLYLDKVAQIVERRHYPQDSPGHELTTAEALITSLQFGAVALFVNIAVLPAVFFAIGAVILIIANAYLISREYFQMSAARHVPMTEAKSLRKTHSTQILLAGLIPAVMALVPIVNLLVPLFATSYFVHIYKAISRSSV